MGRYLREFMNIKSKRNMLLKVPKAFRKKIVGGGVLLLAILFFSPSIWAQDFTEDFENGIPSDWGLFLGEEASHEWQASMEGYQSNGAAILDPKEDNIGEGNSGRYFLVTPSVTVPDDAQLRFWSKYDELGDENTVYSLMISTAPQPDIEDFISLESWTAEDITTEDEYYLQAFDLPAGITPGVEVYLAFVVENTQPGEEASGTSWTIDDVGLISGCPLLDIEEVEVSDITIESAVISWDHPTAEDFDIQVVEEGESIDEDGGENVTNQTYLAEGLEEETSYDVYIKSNCPDNLEGEWQYVATFKTLKLGMSCDAPIEIGDSYALESNLMDFPNAEDVIYEATGSNCFPDASDQNYLAGNKIFFSYTADEDGVINISQMTLPFTPGTDCYGNAASAVMVYEDCSAVGEECLAALRTTDVDAPKHIENFPVEAGQTYIIVMSTTFDTIDTSICFEFDFNFSNCPAPTDVEISNIEQNSAVASWSNVSDMAESWEYVVQPAGSGTPAADAGTETSTNENVELTGLEEGTEYEVFVRSICQSGGGDWGSPFPFMTQCGVQDLPYYSSLDDGDPDVDIDCWAVINANGDDVQWQFQYGSAHLQLNMANGSNDDYLVSPQIDLSGDGVKRIRFEYESYGGDTPVSIFASSTGVGENDFDQTILAETDFAETGWDIFEEKIIVIPDDIDGVINIAFHIADTDPSMTGFDIKNVYVEEMPACSDPLDPTVDNITATTADISWTTGFEETQWEVYLDAITDPEPQPEDSGFIVDDNEYTLDDLEPGSQYRYYVRAYCNEDDQSEWIGPVIFHTTCNTVALELPFEDSFNDDDPDTNKFCWTILNESGVENISFEMEESSVKLLTPVFGFTGDFDEWLISPALQVDEGLYDVSFDLRALGNVMSPEGFGELEVLVSTTNTDPSSFSEIEPTFSFSNSNYETKHIYYEQDADETVYFAIHVPNGADVMGIEVDNFKIDLLQDCPAPTNLEVGDVTSTSAQLDWTAGFNETEWNVAVQPQGSGEPTDDYITVDENTWIADDLEPLNTYEAYVRAVCDEDAGESDWVGPVKFTTQCDAVYDAPFLETFENDSDSRDCWLVVDANEDGDFWHIDSAIHPYEGELSAGAFTGNNGANDDWLISPTINIEGGQRIRFHYAVMDGFFVEDLKVFISTDGANIEDFTTELFDTGEDPINNEEYKEMVLNIPDDITGEIHIGFQIPQYFSSDIYRGQSLFIDNVRVEDIPSCADPINPELSDIQDDNAVLTWDVTGDEDTWEVAVIPEAEVEDPDDIDFDAVDPDYIYETQDMPYQIEGLDPAQRYYVAVRAICSEDEASDWSEAAELITVCDLDDQCEYTITLYSDNSMGVGGGIDVIQNEQVVQTLEFPTGPYMEIPDPEEYTVYLCNGNEFSLFWDSVGTAPDQYPEASVEVHDADGNLIFDSGPGIGTPRTTLFTGWPTCGDIECPQPENIEVDENMEFTWEPVGDESQWEVAIKPVDDGTLPQSGTIVDTPNYTPVEEDFNNLYHMTYDFYVRAVCSDDSQSYWRGPYSFVRGDAPENAVVVPVNEQELCMESVEEVSFRHAHINDTEMSCEGDNIGDVWLEFEATSKVHIIEVGGFTGNFYTSSGDELYPNITTTLYKQEADGELTEMRCSESNVIVAAYASELEVGETYKVRLSLNDPDPSTRLFTVCVTTPQDLCEISTVNGDFERPGLSYFSGIESILVQQVVPNWRMNMETDHGNSIFIWEGLNSNGMDIQPYTGVQFVQIVADEFTDWYDPDDPRGLYTDMETSEITAIDYNYATSARGDGNTIQLYAGPVGGPYEMVREDEGLIGTWEERIGVYEVPEGQDETRFIFVPKDYAIGNLIDKVNLVANNDIITADTTLECQEDMVELAANGVGEWSSDEDNPASVNIEDEDSRETEVTGFTVPGEYTFYWKTRYCEHSVTITYEGLDEIPEVESPVEYCMGQEAEPLYAEPMEGYDVVFFEELGGEAFESLTPDTSVPGTFIYYAVYQTEEGCMGEPAEIEVIINEGLEDAPEVESPIQYCQNQEAEPLYAEPMEGYQLVFFEEQDGEGVESLIPDTSEPGTFIYYAAYQTEEGCRSELVEIEVQVDEAMDPVVEFFYDDYTYCIGNENPSPFVDDNFSEDGEFSVEPSGLSINNEDGTINLEASEPGIYEITYTVNEDLENCQLEGAYTTEIEILPAVEFDLEAYCEGADYIIRPVFVDEDAAIGVEYVWEDENGNQVGSNEELDFNEAFGDEQLPVNVYLTVNTSGCSQTQKLTVTSSVCKIPEGISPNGDGYNDSFDLSGMGVKELIIYNRYGTKVYSKKDYTNEWEGQSDKGKALPSGTYYYVIKTKSGENIKGWVYVNQEV